MTGGAKVEAPGAPLLETGAVRAAPDPPPPPRSVPEIEADLAARRGERVALEDALNRETGGGRKGYGNRTDEHLLRELEAEAARNPKIKKLLEDPEAKEWARLVREREEAIRRRQKAAKAIREDRRKQRIRDRVNGGSTGDYDYKNPNAPARDTNAKQPVGKAPQAPAKPQSPAKPQPTAPKTPATPSVPKPNPPLVKLTQAQWSQKANAMRKLGKTFANGMKVLASGGIPHLLSLAGRIVTALETIANATSAMSGGGFVFKQQVSQVNDLGTKTSRLVSGYKQAGYHKTLDSMIRMAEQFDREDPDALYGSDELSTFCAGIRSDVETHERDCQKLLDQMKDIHQRAVNGMALCEKLLANIAFLTAAQLTGDDLVLFMAYQDFRQIAGILIHVRVLSDHHAEVRGDVQRINSKIIGGFYLDE